MPVLFTGIHRGNHGKVCKYWSGLLMHLDLKLFLNDERHKKHYLLCNYLVSVFFVGCDKQTLKKSVNDDRMKAPLIYTPKQKIKGDQIIW